MTQKSRFTEPYISTRGCLVEMKVEVSDSTLPSPPQNSENPQTVLHKPLLQKRIKTDQIENGTQKGERDEHWTLELEISVFQSQI